MREVGGTTEPQRDGENGGQVDENRKEKFKSAGEETRETGREQPGEFKKIQCRGMAQDLSWELAAERYEEKLIEAKYSW